MRIVIIGNSGSGKTWLANALGTPEQLAVVHLDHLFWEPGGFDRKRSPEDIDRLIEESKKQPTWIAEGVFGEMAKRYLDSATTLIWLDLDWDLCKKRLEQRGSESKRHLGREQSEEGLLKLIEWASHYWNRTDMRSHSGHQQLFTEFKGERHHLKTEHDVVRFVERTQQSDPPGAEPPSPDLR